MVAQVGDLDMTQAHSVLRRYARDHNLKFGDLARDITTRTISARQVIDHAGSRRDA